MRFLLLLPGIVFPPLGSSLLNAWPFFLFPFLLCVSAQGVAGLHGGGKKCVLGDITDGDRFHNFRIEVFFGEIRS